MTAKLIMALSLLLLALQAGVGVAGAQQTGPLGFGSAELREPMETDRPDFTEGTRTIERGHLQIEAGYTFTYDEDPGERVTSHTAPELLLRAGLLADLELRVGWQGYIDEEVADRSLDTTSGSDGLSDMVLGIKHRMYDQSAWLPAFSFIVETSLPTGESGIGEDELQPGVKLLWAYELSESLAAAGNVNFDFPVDEDTRFLETSASYTMAYDFGPLGVYAEYFGFYPSSEAPDTSGRHFLNGGFTLPAGPNLQFDLLAGFGLNSEAEDFFAGAGIALRL